MVDLTKSYNNALLAQSIQPQSNQTPFSGLARILTGLMVGKSMKRSNEQEQAERDAKEASRKQNLAKIMSGMGGEVEAAGPPTLDGQFPTVNQPPDRNKLVSALLESENPAFNQSGLSMLSNRSESSPMSVKEWNFFNNLPEKDQGRFLEMKRALTKVDTGNQVSLLGPGAKPVNTFDKQLAPKDTIQHQADVVTAKEQAKQGVKNAAVAETEQRQAQDGVNLIGSILSNENLGSAFGSVQGLLPSVQQETINVEADLDKLDDMLTVAARGELKGQGQISDSETKMLKKAQSILSNRRIGDDKAKQELMRLQAYFNSILGNEMPTPQTQEDFDALPPGTVYIDPDDGQRYLK